VDDKPSAAQSPVKHHVGVTPDMRVGARDQAAAPPPVAKTRKRRRLRAGALLGGLGAVIGLASLAASAWIYSEMQREVLRVSTEVAQLRVSLDLYAQRSAAAPIAASGKSTDLSALENRLAILEQNWRGAETAVQPTALPAISGPTVATESDGDCLPSGMRLLVAAGDAYPICGTEASIEVMNVSNGYISLTDGTTVPSGGTVPLPGTACMIAVTSGGDEATTGFAEIRVTC
jgi:hypothetical protein